MCGTPDARRVPFRSRARVSFRHRARSSIHDVRDRPRSSVVRPSSGNRTAVRSLRCVRSFELKIPRRPSTWARGRMRANGMPNPTFVVVVHAYVARRRHPRRRRTYLSSSSVCIKPTQTPVARTNADVATVATRIDRFMRNPLNGSRGVRRPNA